ncbi:MAG TPA: M42 family peptidase [Clostridia bacterium]|nr:M42 family peptidase [Clostridia bacterium]
MKQLLQKLCPLPGVSGCEFSVADTVAEHLSLYADVRRDALGSVIGEINNKGQAAPHILLDSHIDQIGLLVTDIDKTGFLRFTMCGKADLRVLSGAEVTVWGKEPLFGVISSTPPHIANPEKAGVAKAASELGIDIGYCEKEARELVTIGDTVTFNSGFFELCDTKISAAALDNRAGAAVILRALELLKDKKHNTKITALFSVLEETGKGGAAAASFGIEPDEAVVFDVSFANYPNSKLAHLSSGPMIGIAPILSREISSKLIKTAENHKIPYTLEVMGGRTSTNADTIAISGKGIKTGLISMPLRNMHSAVEVADINDLEFCSRLIAEYIIKRGNGDA